MYYCPPLQPVTSGLFLYVDSLQDDMKPYDVFEPQISSVTILDMPVENKIDLGVKTG